ncbi:MAG: exonuclease, partial [Acidimicrobiaceae bacterium]|nr:exonuclease [Acidimicrobiaceae bacterium]
MATGMVARVGTTHLSVRVPWHDSGWNGSICSDPSSNASCILLKNVSELRDDAYEIENAGRPLDDLNLKHVGCALERGTFMSSHAYGVVREHPYRYNEALRGKIAPTQLTIPAFGVHAIPYFWLNRKTIDTVVNDFDVDYDDEREQFADKVLGFEPDWVLHGDNQKALIERFFQEVSVSESLVFFYAKHSPLDHLRTGGYLLVGAALIIGEELPGWWRTHSPTPFPNHMWETNIQHSLRPDGRGGILMPVAELAQRDVMGIDVRDALAWAPLGGREFIYVTEHVSADSAIEALEKLFNAAQQCRELGLEIPEVSLEWIAERIGAVWKMRGPAPGLGAVLTALRVPYGEAAGRAITRSTPSGIDPWDYLADVMNSPDKHPESARWIPDTHRRVWATLGQEKLDFLRLLSRFQMSGDQASMLLARKTEISFGYRQMLADPYLAHILTAGSPGPVPLDAIDRGCFPKPAIRTSFPLAEPSAMRDASDRRRIRALIVDILEAAAEEGNTLLPLDRVLEKSETAALAEKCPVSEEILTAHGLHPEQLTYNPESPYWPPFVGARMQDGTAALKLARLETTAFLIREGVKELLRRPRAEAPADLEATLDDVLSGPPTGGSDDADAELRARAEKKAALAEIYAAPLSILNGRAGTGKTTLIRALVARPEIRMGRVLLLAPTGKARVQLQQKARFEAQTIAQFLSRYDRYDGDSGKYLIASGKPKPPRYNTVVIDESSMLTEEQFAAVLDALMIPDRLILVGDPRQLPPIGSGRPFVDLITRLITAQEVPSFPRILPGYAELTELRRQQGEVRDDLKLAAWFTGDEIPPGFDEVWDNLRAGSPMSNLAAVSWSGRRPAEVIDAVIADELSISAADSSAGFETSYGGQRSEKGVTFPKGSHGAAPRAEYWQILSPTRGHAWGTVETNRHFKLKYRQRALDRALLPRSSRTTPRPIGAERIVLGDKVMNNVNARRKPYPDGSGLGYVANGEIGIVVGGLGKPGQAPKYTNIEFSSQIGTTYGYVGDSDDDPTLELAWSITIHKSQGSEFKKVFVVLPASARTLSREMLYTALTRQEERVVLLHEAPLDDLLDLSTSTGSETARRLTDLFFPPDPILVNFPDGRPAGKLDRRLIHAGENSILVRSKNEVIITQILEQLAPGMWQYERPINLNGKIMNPGPDFTITTSERT